MEIIAEAVNAPDGKIGSKRYKVAESGWDGDITSVYTYFKPWNMVIGVSFYKSDSYDAMARISRAGERFIFFLLPIGILMLGFSAFTARLAADRGKEMTGGLVEASNMIRDGNLLKTFPIDPEALEGLLTTFPTIAFDCATPEGMFIRGTREQHQSGFKRDHLIRRIIMRGMRGPLPFNEMHFDQTTADIMSKHVCKVNCRVADEGLRRELEAYIEEHADKLVNAPFDPVMFEISDRHANKGAGVAWLAAHYGISEDECAVYGDGGNDILMLARFKHSYAMINACQEAKDAANHIIGHCAFHAVPHHIMRTLRHDRAERARTTIE